jgi:hypothetical protein
MRVFEEKQPETSRIKSKVEYENQNNIAPADLRDRAGDWCRNHSHNVGANSNPRATRRLVNNELR